ncbi:hypothetical protein CRG98_015054 [Punica granatum]|uniref:Retrovirus-related Pol polyprotein from transposon TNT 1-94-like beta-barrel domain-containing protein n=1 Tax=Punica granatum TaxID=22663 RepID=A0A2I0K7W6_PUNGR|nr:hypothetical protein CRG98_015054 [Punica granatum]
MLMQSPMEIWKALKEKYNTERQGTDKFLMMKYFEFKMLDSVPIMDQVHELQILLPSSWNDYRKKLLHMAEDFTMEKILRHLCIEEETRKRDADCKLLRKDKDATTSKANIVEDMDLVVMVTEGIESLEIVANREVLMGNHQSVKVLGQGTVELNFTSGKKLTLINVLHVPDVRKNLLSASLLFNKGFKVI